ncbi:MAG TPA: hypothetical protein VGO62_06430 [Myxococcota bacterium]
MLTSFALMLALVNPAPPNEVVETLAGAAASLDAPDAWIHVVMIQAGACTKGSPIAFHCPIARTAAPTPGDQLFTVTLTRADFAPSFALTSHEGKVSFTPGILDYGKGMFRTFGTPHVESCGAHCQMPVSEALTFTSCTGDLPAHLTSVQVVFAFTGPWHDGGWSTARTRVVGIRAVGVGGELACVATP